MLRTELVCLCLAFLLAICYARAEQVPMGHQGRKDSRNQAHEVFLL